MFNFPTIIVERQKKKSVSNEMKVATYFLHGETHKTHTFHNSAFLAQSSARNVDMLSTTYS